MVLVCTVPIWATALWMFLLTLYCTRALVFTDDNSVGLSRWLGGNDCHLVALNGLEAIISSAKPSIDLAHVVLLLSNNS
jgi:hypothetical protein